MQTEKQKKAKALKGKQINHRNMKSPSSEGGEYISKSPNENEHDNDQDHSENFDYDKAKGLK